MIRVVKKSLNRLNITVFGMGFERETKRKPLFFGRSTTGL